MYGEASIHVLHVDDEPDFAELTAEFLKREDDNFTVTTATSASEGLEHLSSGEFDCIVSDYDMPTQNGIEFLKSVRENSSDLPFVLFTGKGSEEIAGEAISAGVTDYLQKNRGTDQYTVLANRLRNAVERHRAQRERKRQRKAIETAQEGISILNEDGEYIYVNQAYADMYEYEPEEVVGEDWDLTCPADEQTIVQDVIMPTVAKDGYWSGETTGLRADGTTFVEDHTVAQTETGELICSVRDRSVEQEQETALTQFRTLVETLNDPVYVVDETGQFEYVNDAFIELVGYDRETIIGASPALIKSPEAVDRSEDYLGRILSSEGPDSMQFEIEILPNQGEPIPCEDHMGVLPYEGESFKGSVGILRDISQRKERESMLQKYQYAYESALNGIAIVNLDGKIVDVNAAFMDMWGYEKEGDVLGRPATSMWSDPERAQSVLETVTDQGSREDELEAVRADGSTFYARGVNSYLRDEDENPIGVIASFFDTTERREREAKLETQTAAMEASMDGIAILNPAGEYTYMNQAHADVFDYDADTLIGSSWQRLCDDDEIERIDQEVLPMLRDEGTWRGEVVGTRRDGSNVSQEVTLSLLDDGKVIYTNRDITERKKREQELEQTNSVLRTIVETLPMGVLVEDTKRDVLIANDHLGETLGIPIDGEELIGRDCATAAEEIKSRFTDPEAFIEVISERLEQRELVQNEELHLTDGRVIERDYVPYTLPDGEANLWLYRDVTTRKQQSQELEQANEFLSQTQTVANVGGWEFDIQTESLRWTDEVYRIHGVNMDFEPTIEDAVEFYHPEDRATIQDAIERVTTEGEPYDLELRIITADDEVRWVRTRGEPWREDGKIVGVRGTFQDITQRIKRQQRLEEFASVVSHDLRNPLNVATGHLDLVANECDSDHLDSVRRALERMEALIEDLLILAQDNKEVSDTQPVDLAMIADGCWENVQTEQGRIITTVDQTVWADNSRLKQVFENLFRNAVEHGGPEVTVTVGELADGFYVEDDGAGISTNERNAVFEMGYSQSANGTGFGLNIVKQIVDAHDWQIRVTDGTDGGARFEITNVNFVDT
ncbi:PAS domain S-box protein [Halorubrum sp. ASP121]|uniref:PAS domain S-box protein n=1 Tax=Halorubrum sp. ASP121 TaxID=1855858 RepID=UPI0010FA0F0F|nr:PAS domain S-box protein [Halorubrum sp. ASP121]TKX50367.1 PAS domain S-box protein [Halorubrum sp. ASP121]